LQQNGIIIETFRSSDSDLLREVFPGMPTLKNGYLYLNEAPGLGVEINEKLAAKYPVTGGAINAIRKRDGTVIRP
jgi:mannonate dehydratase